MKTLKIKLGEWHRRFAFLPVIRDGAVQSDENGQYLERTRFWLEHYWENVFYSGMKRVLTSNIMSDDEYFELWLPAFAEEMQTRTNGENNYDQSSFEKPEVRAELKEICLAGNSVEKAVELKTGKSYRDYAVARLVVDLRKFSVFPDLTSGQRDALSDKLALVILSCVMPALGKPMTSREHRLEYPPRVIAETISKLANSGKLTLKELGNNRFQLNLADCDEPFIIE